MEQVDWEVEDIARKFGAPQKQYKHESHQKNPRPTALKRIDLYLALFSAEALEGECGLQTQFPL